MECNVGKTDKTIRIILALIFAYLGYTYSSWYYIGTIILGLTAILGHCQLYSWFNINTCK